MRLRYAVMTVAIILVLSWAPLQARPWPVRAARNIGHNAKLAAVDCVMTWRGRAECGAIVGAMAYDYRTTREFERYYPYLREANPLFGGKAPAWRMLLIGGAITFAQIDANDYIARNSTHPWELIPLTFEAGGHIVAGLSNERLIAACQRSGACQTSVPFAVALQ